LHFRAKGVPCAGTVTGGSDNTFAILDFSTNQLGIPIQPEFYSDAQRASFAAPGHPGLDLSFQNRGCNTLGGSFLVNEATFSPDGLTVDTFSAAFEEHYEGAEPALFGRFDFEANPAPPVPEPGTLMLVSMGLASAWRRRNR
jgi:hypothetical protein